MTNIEIIESEKEVRGIDVEVNTYQGWKRKGKQVAKGEKMVFKTKIWMPKKKNKKDEENKENEKTKSRFIMTTAFFFTEDQVS